MAQLLPAFNQSSHTAATTSCSEEQVIALLCNLEMGDDDWSDAGLPGLLKYTYGAKGYEFPAGGSVASLRHISSKFN